MLLLFISTQNRFENSNYYIQPLTASGSNLDEMLEINNHNTDDQQKQEFVTNNKENNVNKKY